MGVDDATSALFFVLGCLSEYQGRVIVERGDLVERFLSDERDRVDVFRSYLSRLAEERGIASTIREETDEAGCTGFYSRELTGLIDGWYAFDFAKSSFVGTESEPRRTEARLSRETFKRQGVVETLSYLAGAYARHGTGNTFRLPNARHKAEIIAGLLRELGCLGVEVSRANPGYVPSIDEVVFQPSENVAQRLRPLWRP